jgi:hypothetical protein
MIFEILYTKLKKGFKNAAFDADFESVEKKASNKFTRKQLDTKKDEKHNYSFIFLLVIFFLSTFLCSYWTFVKNCFQVMWALFANS